MANADSPECFGKISRPNVFDRVAAAIMKGVSQCDPIKQCSAHMMGLVFKKIHYRNKKKPPLTAGTTTSSYCTAKLSVSVSLCQRRGPTRSIYSANAE